MNRFVTTCRIVGGQFSGAAFPLDCYPLIDFPHNHLLSPLVSSAAEFIDDGFVTRSTPFTRFYPPESIFTHFARKNLENLRFFLSLPFRC